MKSINQLDRVGIADYLKEQTDRHLTNISKLSNLRIQSLGYLLNAFSLGAFKTPVTLEHEYIAEAEINVRIAYTVGEKLTLIQLFGNGDVYINVNLELTLLKALAIIYIDWLRLKSKRLI